VTEAWAWAALAGLGAFHGLNPAMGWLFAVAIGLHRGRRFVVIQSLIPIAIGHLLSIAVVAGAILVLGVVVDRRWLLMVAGGGLILWALYHLANGSRHHSRIGMRAGFAGLLAWSFLMASAHGAGPMLVPALVPLPFGERGRRHNRYGLAGQLARRSRRPHGSHAERQRNHRDPGLRLDRGRVPAARMDQFGLVVDGSARRYWNDRAGALSPIQSWATRR